MCISDLQVFNTLPTAISNHRCYFSVKLQSTSFTDTLTMLTDNWDFFFANYGMYVQDLIKISYLRLLGMWLAIQRYTCSYIK